MKGRLPRVRRGTALEPCMRSARDAFAYLVDQPGLADSCLAHDEDVLPFVVLRAAPAIHECRELDFAADEAAESCGQVETAAHAARPYDSVKRHRFAHTFERLRPMVFH